MTKLLDIWRNWDKVKIIWRMFWNIVGSLMQQGKTQDQAIRMIFNLVAERHKMTPDERADAERAWFDHASQSGFN